MKTTILTIALMLTLSINNLFAGINGSVNVSSNSSYISLAPVTPAEATFEEMSESLLITGSWLAPVTPAEADFTDSAPETMVDLSVLAPVTPSEADFNDSTETSGISDISPKTPAVADFEETI